MSIAAPIFGIDVHPQYQRGLDFERASGQGYKFGFIKVSEGPYRDGTVWNHPELGSFVKRAQNSGLLVGYYHFLVESDGDDPERGGRIQAELFWRRVRAFGGARGRMLCVDFEEYNPKYRWLTPSNATLKAFDRRLNELSGNHPLILYSGPGFWNGGDSSGDFDQYGADVLWEARYPDLQVMPSPREEYQSLKDWGWKGFGGEVPAFWQFTPAGTVAGMNMDVNAYRLPINHLRSLAVTPLPNEDEEPDEEQPRPRGNGLMNTVDDVAEYGMAHVRAGVKYWCWDEGNLNVPRPSVGRPASVDGKAPVPGQVRRGFCLTGDTLVIAEDIERSYKRPYSGEVIAIETARGHKLTGTPNHPILTDKGWVALGALRKGNHVVSSRAFGQQARLDPDHDQRPARLEEVHRSLSDTGHVERDVCGPFDFHGDGMVDGEVEVVVPEGVLWDELRFKAALPEQGFKLGFPYATPADAALALLSGGDQVAADPGLFSGFVGGPELGQYLSLGHARVLEPLRFGSVPDVHAGLLDPALHNPQAHAQSDGDGAGRFSRHVGRDYGLGVEVEPQSGRRAGGALPAQLGGLAPTAHASSSAPEPFGDGVVANPDPLGDFPGGLPADISLDKIVSVDVNPFSGHVYNLQTRTNRYVANGIISHNCADLISWQLRKAGKSIPKNRFGDENYDGGTRSFQLRYASVMKRFKLSECRRGDVPFVDFQTSWAPEGHIAFCLGDGPDAKLLQSHLDSLCGVGEPGFNADFTLAQSNSMPSGRNYYTHRIPREAIWG